MLLLKAKSTGPDLFSTLVPVKGHTNSHGHFVAPHTATRQKRAVETASAEPAQQADLFGKGAPKKPMFLVMRHPEVAAPSTVPDLASYDHVLVMFSGGKDSIACVVRLLELGVPRDKIELWHHDIDGGGRSLMDWPITPAYCREVAKALGVPIYFSHREGGFEREMNRKDQATAAVIFDNPDGTKGRAGGVSNKLNTRGKFPQVSADLSVRWCSGALKVDVGAAAIRNQDRFKGKRTLVVTGERGQESSNRAKYAVLEPDRTHTQGRHVDHWRPVHAWKDEDVWDAMRRNGIVAHPAYQLGYGRLSCRNCIFGDEDQWATNSHLYPESVGEIGGYEKQFNTTIHRKETVHERAAKGTPYAAAVANPDLAALADAREWDGSPVVVDPAEWRMPAGARNKSKSGPS